MMVAVSAEYRLHPLTAPLSPWYANDWHSGVCAQLSAQFAALDESPPSVMRDEYASWALPTAPQVAPDGGGLTAVQAGVEGVRVMSSKRSSAP